MSLCISLHQPKKSRTNVLPCIAMSLISPGLMRYMSSCSRRSSQGVAFRTIIPDLTFRLSSSILDTSISSHIRRSILSVARLLTLVTSKTPLLPSFVPPPPLHHLTLHHYYLLVPRERITPQILVERAMASHTLHEIIVSDLTIILTIVIRSLANLVGLPILPLLMLLSLHPRI